VVRDVVEAIQGTSSEKPVPNPDLNGILSAFPDETLTGLHMKRLTLIRHAKSSWKEKGLADFDRPLNARGRSDAPLMGRRLAARGEMPDLVICSPARRAVATMKKIAREAGFPPCRIVEDERMYPADADELLRIVREIADCHDDVVLCGHNPGLTEFSNLVSNHFIDNIPTCGVVAIDFRLDSWKAVVPGSGELRYLDWPKRIGDPD
jgi:phosphohistidine phosphatase